MSRPLPFLAALRAAAAPGRLAIIAEIKPALPGGEDLLRGRDPLALASAYAAGGAACLSVVTGRWYGGTPQLLARVAGGTTLPILRKDFIVNRAALEASVRLGAAAVLLTRKLLRRRDLLDLAAAAAALGLTPFVEVAGEDELAGLDLPEAAIVAVNNRDIATRETAGEGIARSLRLLAQAKATGAGLVASASGVASPADARRLARAGFAAALVGTALLRAPDPRLAVRELTAASTNRG